MVGQDEERIFFALWPGAETRAALQQAAQSVAIERPARRVPVYNLHLTLHFIGNVSRETAQAMRSAAHAVEASAFELRMDRVSPTCMPRWRRRWHPAVIARNDAGLPRTSLSRARSMSLPPRRSLPRSNGGSRILYCCCLEPSTMAYNTKSPKPIR